uniref:Uncharacterized protein n=1 Tax=Rhipicephalus microplus TaxID=6941 RepID=A0A6G5AFX3_RHIMP
MISPALAITSDLFPSENICVRFITRGSHGTWNNHLVPIQEQNMQTFIIPHEFNQMASLRTMDSRKLTAHILPITHVNIMKTLTLPLELRILFTVVHYLFWKMNGNCTSIVHITL